MKKEEVAAAMDGLRKGNCAKPEEARRDVRPIVGDVMGMDSAAEIHGFALDHMKVDRAGVEGAPALRALFKVAAITRRPAPVHVAQDSAGLAAKFPGAARFVTPGRYIPWAFKLKCKRSRAPAVAGDFASANPRAATVSPEGGFVAGAAGVTVGRFA